MSRSITVHKSIVFYTEITSGLCTIYRVCSESLFGLNFSRLDGAMERVLLSWPSLRPVASIPLPSRIFNEPQTRRPVTHRDAALRRVGLIRTP